MLPVVSAGEVAFLVSGIYGLPKKFGAAFVCFMVSAVAHYAVAVGLGIHVADLQLFLALSILDPLVLCFGAFPIGVAAGRHHFSRLFFNVLTFVGRLGVSFPHR